MLGFETKNKYRILDEDMEPIAYAAEESIGMMAAVSRAFFKHFRSFVINIYSHERELMYKAKFPFRWFFKTLHLEDSNGKSMGSLQQRFAFFYKKFDVFDSNGRIVARVKSPLFKMWTFEFEFRNRKIGTIQKKWSGALTEIFTDKDNFIVSFSQPDLTLELKATMMAACLMVDIVYFENNQGSGSLLDLAN